jgi:hypothetical protein
MKIVAYSLWGNNPKYTIGALRNAELVKKLYPGWTARFYVGTSVPLDIKESLLQKNAEVIEMNEPGDWRGMFWRFEAAADSMVEAMISRDCDSRITSREAAAVEEWMNSNFMFHIMRDHPWHNAPILGGMWGVKAPFLRNIKDLMSQFDKGNFWQVDQNFLKLLYPYVVNHAMVHDEFFEKKPWPMQRVGLEFVGQVFDENEETIQEHLDMLSKHIL